MDDFQELEIEQRAEWMIMRSLKTQSKTRETSRSCNVNASPRLPQHEIIE